MITIWCDVGRPYRPVLRLKPLRLLEAQQLSALDSNQLHLAPVVDLVDANEVQMYTMALDPRNLSERYKQVKQLPVTHMEVHPRNFLGPNGALVIHSNRIAGPRTTYAEGQRKQAIGPDFSPATKMGPNRASLHNPQRNLCQTDISMILGPAVQLDGQVGIVALTTGDGHEQDDAITIGMGTTQRGFGHVSYYKHYRDDEKKDGSLSSGTRQQYQKAPAGVWHKKKANDNHIHPKEGHPYLHAILGPSSVMIGKTVPQKRKSQSSNVRQSGNRPNIKDASIVRKGDSDPFCVVIKFVKNINTRGLSSIKVLVRSFRTVVEANKWCSGHGQKGVIARVMPQHKMLFDPVTGMTVDMLANSNMLSSRSSSFFILFYFCYFCYFVLLFAIGKQYRGSRRTLTIRSRFIQARSQT
jgi:DNA-directed RNA polymerase II subunit RPB2